MLVDEAAVLVDIALYKSVWCSLTFMFIVRWISQEYNSFCLGNSVSNYQLQVSLTATGDAGDALNYPPSPPNYKSFQTSFGDCTSSGHGPFWYTATPNLCCVTKWFGINGAGFNWGAYNRLSILRVMVQQLN